MNITLTNRIGNPPAGSTINIPDSTATRLIRNGDAKLATAEAKPKRGKRTPRTGDATPTPHPSADSRGVGGDPSEAGRQTAG